MKSTSVQMGIGQRWSGTHIRGETRDIQRELGSERADMLRRIGLMVAQMSLMQSLVCAESWRPHFSFLRDSQRAEFLVPPEQLVVLLTVVFQGIYLPYGPSNPQYRQRLLLIWCLCSLLFNLLSLPSLSERSTHGVDRDSNLAIEDSSLGGFREF